MKHTVRALALTIAVAGIAAGAHSGKTVASSQVGLQGMPVPTCPLNSGGCGMWK